MPRKKMLGKVTLTARGFERIDFNDYYHTACSLQQSSLATKRAIWLGKELERMHLTAPQVRELVATLQNWLETDSFRKPKPPKKTTKRRYRAP